MHELLQQMRDINEMDLHDLDHQEGMFNSAFQWAAKQVGVTTDQDRIVKFFTDNADQTTLLQNFINGSKNPHDIFDVLAKYAGGKVCMNILDEKSPTEARNDDNLNDKMAKDHRIDEAKKHFKKIKDDIKKKDLIQILTFILTPRQDKDDKLPETKTPLDVFNDLVLQVMLRTEMMKIWNVPK